MKNEAKGVIAMITNKQYMSGEATHEEYYGQFVTEAVKNRVLFLFPLETLKRSTDPHFNDSPLERWDLVLNPLPKSIGDKIRATGTFASLSDCVCIAKEAARQIKEEAEK